MKNQKHLFNLNNQSGFIIADFLFAFVLVLGCGILIFALTFSLATIEISQYIVWSTARNYSAANFKTRSPVIADGYTVNSPFAELQALDKFNNLADKFPLLTGRGSAKPWVTLDNPLVGDLIKIDSDLSSKIGPERLNKDGGQQVRQPWIGAKADLKLNLLLEVKVPFLGPFADQSNADKFTFPIRAFILRHPSQQECLNFYSKRYTEGIQKIPGENFKLLPDGSAQYSPMEDNGC